MCSALFVKLLSISSVTCAFIEVLILSVCLSVLSVSVYINNFLIGMEEFQKVQLRWRSSTNSDYYNPELRESPETGVRVLLVFSDVELFRCAH